MGFGVIGNCCVGVIDVKLFGWVIDWCCDVVGWLFSYIVGFFF